MRAGRGFTLLEVLVATVVAGLLLGALGAAIASARRHEASSEAEADSRAASRLAGALLREELRLAGSVPWPLPADAGPYVEEGAWVGPALTLSSGPGGDVLSVQGFDHRDLAAPTARTFTFESGLDGRGEAQLYRRSGGAARQPLVGGVDRLRVLWVVDADGVLRTIESAGGLRVAALGVEVGAGARPAHVVAELPARPRLLVVGAP